MTAELVIPKPFAGRSAINLSTRFTGLPSSSIPNNSESDLDEIYSNPFFSASTAASLKASLDILPIAFAVSAKELATDISALITPIESLLTCLLYFTTINYSYKNLPRLMQGLTMHLSVKL